ncbi:MAG: transglutaminase-like domain-containing protein [Phycisphaerales bacterium]
MKIMRSFYVLACAWGVSLAGNFAVAAQQDIAPIAPPVAVAEQAFEVSDEAVAELINDLIIAPESDWYGVYVQGNKVGTAQASAERVVDVDGVPAVRSLLDATMNLRAMGEDVTIEFSYEILFDAQPPYAFRAMHVRELMGDQGREVHVVRSNPGGDTQPGGDMIATITEAGQTSTRNLGELDHSIHDYFATDIWMKTQPTVGDAITYPSFDLNSLRMMSETATVTGIEHAMAGGVPLTCFTLDIADSNDDAYEVVVDEHGTWLTLDFGGMARFQLEPEAIAKQRDASVDLFISNLVKLDQPLGDVTTIRTLVLEVDDETAERIGSASGQMIDRDPHTGRALLILGHEYREAADEAAIRRALEATIESPADHPDIKALAEQAVAGKTTIEEKVQALIDFVDTFVHDDYNANQLSVLDILRVKRGDCSEHAALFTALARAVGIPCRGVEGLVYIGDEHQSLGGHAWNEVVLDGYWQPVDPTWGERNINPSHIRFPTDGRGGSMAMSAMPRMRMRVEQIVRE